MILNTCPDVTFIEDCAALVAKDMGRGRLIRERLASSVHKRLRAISSAAGTASTDGLAGFRRSA
jgi:hypothetical protein